MKEGRQFGEGWSKKEDKQLDWVRKKAGNLEGGGVWKKAGKNLEKDEVVGLIKKEDRK